MLPTVGGVTIRPEYNGTTLLSALRFLLNCNLGNKECSQQLADPGITVPPSVQH